MARAYDSIPRNVAVAIGFIAASAVASAGGAANDGGRKTTNSFTLLMGAAAPQPAVPIPSPGAALAPSRPVVVNPYHVPLIQNAGSLGSAR